MTINLNPLDQDRKAFLFFLGEFPSEAISINIEMASDGSTRRHAVALSPWCEEAIQAYLGLPSSRGRCRCSP